MPELQDPYEVALRLAKTADDLTYDITSFTVQDLSNILSEAANFLMRYADECNSYIARTRITLNIGHEVIDLTEEILPLIGSALLREKIVDTILNNINEEN